MPTTRRATIAASLVFLLFGCPSLSGYEDCPANKSPVVNSGIGFDMSYGEQADFVLESVEDTDEERLHYRFVSSDGEGRTSSVTMEKTDAERLDMPTVGSSYQLYASSTGCDCSELEIYDDGAFVFAAFSGYDRGYLGGQIDYGEPVGSCVAPNGGIRELLSFVFPGGETVESGNEAEIMWPAETEQSATAILHDVFQVQATLFGGTVDGSAQFGAGVIGKPNSL